MTNPKTKTFTVIPDKDQADAPGSIRFTPTIGLFRCPCGGTAQTGRVKEGDEDLPTMVHSQPPCAGFVKLEPHEYVRWVRLNGGVVLD